MDLMCGLQDTAKRIYHAYHSDRGSGFCHFFIAPA